MRTYRNADVHARVWPFLPNGQSLSLEPGETVELDLPDDFDDGFLVADKDKKPSKKADTFAADSSDQPDSSPVKENA